MSLLARISAAALARHQRTCPWPTGSGAITTRAKGATMTSKAPSSDSQPLTGAERPLAPEGASEAASGPESYVGVISDAELLRQANDLIGVLRDNVDHAEAKIIEQDDAMLTAMRNLVANDAEIKANRLWISAQEDTIEHYKADITEAMATIARMRTGRP